jgi:hypothetical protein
VSQNWGLAFREGPEELLLHQRVSFDGQPRARHSVNGMGICQGLRALVFPSSPYGSRHHKRRAQRWVNLDNRNASPRWSLCGSAVEPLFSVFFLLLWFLSSACCLNPAVFRRTGLSLQTIPNKCQPSESVLLSWPNTIWCCSRRPLARYRSVVEVEKVIRRSDFPGG